jgi:hypothetical protein
VRLDLANLFRHNNEHIVVIPKLIYAANYLATSAATPGSSSIRWRSASPAPGSSSPSRAILCATRRAG